MRRGECVDLRSRGTNGNFFPLTLTGSSFCLHFPGGALLHQLRKEKKVCERRGEDNLNFFTLFLFYFHHALSCQRGCVQWHTWRGPWIWKRSHKETRCSGRPWQGSTVPLRKNQTNGSWWVLLSWNWNWVLLQAELNLLHLQQTRWWTCGDDWWVRGRNKSSCRPCTHSSPSSFPSVYPPPAPWFDWNRRRRKHSELLCFNMTKNRGAKTTNCAFRY